MFGIRVGEKQPIAPGEPRAGRQGVRLSHPTFRQLFNPDRAERRDLGFQFLEDRGRSVLRLIVNNQDLSNPLLGGHGSHRGSDGRFLVPSRNDHRDPTFVNSGHACGPRSVEA